MTFNAAALLLLIAGLALIGWLAGRARSNLLAGRAGTKLHSRPQYHGWYVALWLFAPAAIFLAVWSSVSPALITNQVLASEAAQGLPSFGFERGAILSDARDVAQGRAADVRLPAAARPHDRGPLGGPRPRDGRVAGRLVARGRRRGG